jgi:hypothetical protein
LLVLVVSSGLAVSSAHAAPIYDWAFTSGTATNATASDGSFTATITADGSQSFSYPTSYLNSSGGNSGDALNLGFSEPIDALSFDIGSLDTTTGESVTFSTAPVLTASTSVDWVLLGPAVLTGTTVMHGSTQATGGRVTFTGLGGITSFTFSENWVGGHAIYYDNFSATAIPEPAAAALLGLGLIGLTAAAHRRARH